MKVDCNNGVPLITSTDDRKGAVERTQKFPTQGIVRGTKEGCEKSHFFTYITKKYAQAESLKYIIKDSRRYIYSFVQYSVYAYVF